MDLFGDEPLSIDEIKNRLRSGDVTGAETVAQELLATEPDNVQAKMLYGTCRQLQGDDETFRRIHDELVPKMATVVDGETQGLWRKYHTLWISMIATGLALAGGVVAIAHLGRTITSECNVTSLYGGPGYQKLQQSDPPLDVGKWDDRTRFWNISLYVATHHEKLEKTEAERFDATKDKQPHAK